ncbi:L7Ae/L30e/S12e/Gadd45 family ribosomal protein [Acholeplasma hippikon]|uniref:50S ribosomal protein, L7Ae family n=1 Tax=Acholeplasma hippikon TaxID=264636 RepID=A0A449BJV4_9MOLU|nr:ribosomal L7Ae/L30e/S12e/Gadd45 family protein [Acholeplasma hippikon]VEU82673.1 50S ribosomal protein, L7Ae family [Acholeplasma hippikon]
MNKGALGLAYRAKKIILGTDYVVEAMRHGELSLILLASDAGENTKKKISDKAKTYQVEVNDRHSTEELSSAIGKQNVKVVGIKDKGFGELLK